MIKSLQRRTILITTLSVGLVLLFIVSAMNILNYKQTIQEADFVLEHLVRNGGTFSPNAPREPGMRPETQFDTRYFSVTFDDEKTSLLVDVKHVYAIDKEEAINYANKIKDKEKKKGTLSHYRYRHVQNEDTDMVVFVDIERSLNGFYSFLSNSILIALSSMSIVVLLAIFFSKILLKPVKEAYFKQKRFITDASHELKTPLSIINANMDILEMDDEKNQWIDSTKRQVDRMSNTVSDLLFLSKMDEARNKENTQSLNLKDILENVIYDYQPMIGENFKLNLDLYDFTKDVDLQMMMRLFNTLIENAIKYGTQNELLDISLKKNVFKISNHTHLEDTKNLDDLFGRFVRVDASRNQALGGSGIGLSIAKSIVDHLEGDISANLEDHIFSIIIHF